MTVYGQSGLGAGTALTTSFTIDNTAPEILDIDLSGVEQDRLTVRAKDNRHVAAVALLNASGSRKLCAVSPNQTEPGREVTLSLDLSTAYGREFLVAVYDYAKNVTTYRVEMDLGTMERAHFTAIDYVTMSYVGVDEAGQTSFLADLDLPSLPRAAEYVGGHVFLITDDNSLCVANDEDLSLTQRIGALDPTDSMGITFCNDLAYNYADGKLYVQYYSERNRELRPYLAVIDPDDGSLETVCELPRDVNTMAIDPQGNFYSAGYDSNVLYTYTLSQPTPVEQQSGRKQAAGGLNSMGAVTMLAAAATEDTVRVDITLPAAGTNADMTVAYDASMLELADVSGGCAAFAWSSADGQIRLSLASDGAISDRQTVASLVFRSIGSGETTLRVNTEWLSGGAYSHEQRLELELTHAHSYEAVVTGPTCTEAGYTTYTCACGHSYTGDETEALGHSWQGTRCTRCDAERVNPFVDVPMDSYYLDPVLWALEEGITRGISEDHFGPADITNRAQVVTFLWRAKGSPEAAAEADFTDLAPGAFYMKAVSWAVEAGVTMGLGDGSFGVGNPCNRAETVTFLYRAMAD